MKKNKYFFNIYVKAFYGINIIFKKYNFLKYIKYYYRLYLL